VQQGNQVVVQIRLRPAGYPGDNSGNDDIGDLADDNKDDRDCDRLNIDIRAKELGPTLNLLKDLARDRALSTRIIQRFRRGYCKPLSSASSAVPYP